MDKKEIYSFISGFFILFLIYHFPEFFSVFWVAAVFKTVFLLVALLLAFFQGWRKVSIYGLILKSKWGLKLFLGLIVGLFGFGLSVLISTLFGFEKIVSFPSTQMLIDQLPMILLMTSIPSIAEDILTRGYLFGHLKNVMSGKMWILISAVVYVLNHIWRLTDGVAVLSYLFLLGLLLAYTVWDTKSLWLAFGIHWGANIAFESTNSLIKTESEGFYQGSTWILALVWGFLLIIMISFKYLRGTKSPVLDT